MNQNKVLLLALMAVFLFASVAAAAITPVAEEIVQLVNNHPKSLWKAEHNKFSSYSDEQLRRMLGVKETKGLRRPALHFNSRSRKAGPTPPENFDSRTQWPNCIHPIRDQGHCGSCWAFANSETLSDRFCIHSNGTVDVILSPQELVSCDYLDSGCQGGMPRQAWYYTMHKGLVPESCFPYQSINGSQVSCPTNCKDDPSKTLASSKYYAKTWHVITSWFQAMELTIRQEVMANGPVEATMTVFRDFVQYKTGVYHHLTGVVLGLHAVKLVGWGVEESTKTPYWIVANSWSEKWGEEGYFRILRGRDESSIEDELYSVVPDLDRIPKH